MAFVSWRWNKKNVSSLPHFGHSIMKDFPDTRREKDQERVFLTTQVFNLHFFTNLRYLPT